jgi:hypothetical protein
MTTFKLPNKVVVNLTTLTTGSLLILFLFFPWISMQSLDYSAWDLLKNTSDANRFVSYSKPEILNNAYKDIRNILYLVSVLACFSILLAFNIKVKYFDYILLTVIFILCFVSLKLFTELATINKKLVGFGLFGTITLSIFMLTYTINKILKNHTISYEGFKTIAISMYDIVMFVLFSSFSFCAFYAIYDIFIVGN